MSKLQTGGGKTLGNEEMFVNFMILGLRRTTYFMNTLGTEMFALGQKQLETTVIIKIQTHPCYLETLTDFHGDEAKKIQIG